MLYETSKNYKGRIIIIVLSKSIKHSQVTHAQLVLDTYAPCKRNTPKLMGNNVSELP